MDLSTNFIQNIGSNWNLFLENKCEPKLANGFLMEPTSSSLMYQNFPFEQFTREGASPNPFFGVPTQFSESFDPFETSSTNSYLKDLPALYASRHAILNGGNGFSHGSLSMGVFNFPLKTPPPPTDQAPIYDPLNFQVLGSEMENSPEEVSCISTVENGNHKKADNRKKKKKMMMKKKNLLAKKKINEGHRKSELIKGQWSPEEDRLLVQLVTQHGVRRWSHVAQMLPGRIGKQCRDRWQNHLRPDIKKNAWSEEEDKLLIALHRQVGNRWSEISRRIPGRSENTIKNHWNATKRRQLSSRNSGKSKRNTLLQDYIRSTISSSPNDQINVQETVFSANPTAHPETSVSKNIDHQPVMNFSSDTNVPLSSPEQYSLSSMLGDMAGPQGYSFSSMLGENPSGGPMVFDDQSNLLFDQLQLDLTSQLAYDVKKEMEMDFLREMLYK